MVAFKRTQGALANKQISEFTEKMERLTQSASGLEKLRNAGLANCGGNIDLDELMEKLNQIEI